MNLEKLKEHLKGKVKFAGVVTVMVLIFAFVFIKIAGFTNPDKTYGPVLSTELPEVKEKGIAKNKFEAKRHVAEYDNSRSKNRSMSADLDFNFNSAFPDFEDMPADDDVVESTPEYIRQYNTISTGTRSHRETFYNYQPDRDMENERLKKELEALKSHNNKPDPNGISTAENFLAQSFALMAGQFGQQMSGNGDEKIEQPGKEAQINLVGARDNTVSSLSHSFTEGLSPGFITAVGKQTGTRQNSIRACIDGEQTVMNNSPVRIRILDDVEINSFLIPRNSIVTGICRIANQRLDITVNSLESGGNILNVALAVYDNDGQKGIFVHNSNENTAVAEAAGSAGQSIGSGLTINRNAKQQIATDVVRGTMAAATQYVSTKTREVKILLRSDHQILLIQTK